MADVYSFGIEDRCMGGPCPYATRMACRFLGRVHFRVFTGSGPSAPVI